MNTLSTKKVKRAEKIGEACIRLFALKQMKGSHRYYTTGGTKTALGIGRFVIELTKKSKTR